MLCIYKGNVSGTYIYIYKQSSKTLLHKIIGSLLKITITIGT